MHTNILFINRNDRLSLITDFTKWWRIRHPKSIVFATHENIASPMQLIELIEGAKFAQIPKLNAHGYPSWLRDFIRDYKIGCIVPLTDRDLLALSGQRKFFDARGTRLAAASFREIAVYSDKAGYTHLGGKNWSVPRSLVMISDLYESYLEELGEPPWILKPRNGTSSKSTTIIRNKHQFAQLGTISQDFVAQKFVGGIHFTVDVVQASKYRKHAVRKRDLIVGSQSVTMSCCTDATVLRIAEDIVNTINLEGVWNFQVIANAEGGFLHDINPRASSGIYHSISRGLQFYEYIEYMVTNDESVFTDTPIRNDLTMSIIQHYQIGQMS